MHKSCSKMLEQQQQQNIFAGQAINCCIRRWPKYTLMEPARGHVFPKCPIMHWDIKITLGGGGGVEMVTKLKASTLHPSIFDKDW